MMPLGCLPLIIFFWLLFMLPFFFGNFILTALVKLGFAPWVGAHIVFWIFFGGMINIPVKKIPRNAPVEVYPPAYLGMDRFFRRYWDMDYTVIAVNLGGCVIPCLIAVYEGLILAQVGPRAVTAGLIATAINILVCYRLAKPVPYVGIAMPAFVPPLMAALCALILLPELAPPVAFIAGVLGPLIGADLMHMKDLNRISTGMASIGGAGTFDGIVLSGLIAALLA